MNDAMDELYRAQAARERARANLASIAAMVMLITAPALVVLAYLVAL